MTSVSAGGTVSGEQYCNTFLHLQNTEDMEHTRFGSIKSRNNYDCQSTRLTSRSISLAYRTNLVAKETERAFKMPRFL